MLAQGVRHLHWEQVVDDVVSVDQVRRYKPHPKAYQLICDKYGVTPDAVYFVSSNGWDVSGAAHFGFRTVWVNRRDQPFEQLDVRPFSVVRQLKELLSVFSEGAQP
ncbi:haloacid dehalogenase, type II [Sulfobacillus acidophilus TPY]|nr:haloacid dehalogenase, type II [Sulfobacillus acidophilus TPY]